jgi:hypothetical protein
MNIRLFIKISTIIVSSFVWSFIILNIKSFVLKCILLFCAYYSTKYILNKSLLYYDKSLRNVRQYITSESESENSLYNNNIIRSKFKCHKSSDVLNSDDLSNSDSSCDDNKKICKHCRYKTLNNINNILHSNSSSDDTSSNESDKDEDEVFEDEVFEDEVDKDEVQVDEDEVDKDEDEVDEDEVQVDEVQVDKDQLNKDKESNILQIQLDDNINQLKQLKKISKTNTNIYTQFKKRSRTIV